MTGVYAQKLDALVGDTLSPEEFTHLDHVGVACEALRGHEFFEAVKLVAQGLSRLTVRAGVPEKYNATLTFASMSLIAERVKTAPCPSAEEFVTRDGSIFSDGFLKAQFPETRLGSELAREVALLPGAQFQHR